LLQVRQMIPVFPALALIGALGMEGLREQEQHHDLWKIARGLSAAAIGLALVTALLAFVDTNPLPVMLGMETDEDYLLERLQAHYVAMQAVNDLEGDPVVLFLWEPRTYYCEQTCIPDSIINQWWHDRRVYGSPAAVADHWREQGITHVLVFETGGRFLIEQEPHDPTDETDWTDLAVLRETEMMPLWDDLDSYTLYELISPSNGE
nr:hypothetical protein [Anaerolineae bacterium]